MFNTLQIMQITVLSLWMVRNASKARIANAGCKLIASIYKCEDPDLSLNKFRFKFYELLKAKSALKIDKLPPSEGVAKMHAYRVYFQLQTWLGNKKNATDWGWKMTKNILMPEYTDMTLIPEDLMKKISCGCKTGCHNTQCGCRKHGLKCTDLCTTCDPDCCQNFEEQAFDYTIDSKEAIMESDLPDLNFEMVVHSENTEKSVAINETVEEEPGCSSAKKRKKNRKK